MPTGFQSGQAGNAVPLSGEAEIRNASSGTDVLTITGHSSMSTAADFLVLRGDILEGSSGSATERFSVGSSGQLRQYKRYARTESTASTAPTLGASQSGQVVTYAGFTSGPRVLLPAPVPGLTYTLIQGAAMASHALHVSATRGTNAEIRAPFRASGLSTALVVGAPTTVAGMAAVFVAVSTLTWQMFPAINGIEETSIVSEISGCWTSVVA